MSSTTHTERALVTLRQHILSGAISGGERLFEVALANQLQISRTPVRAALSKLAEEGLLDRVPGGGFGVRRFNLRDVADTIELRGVLEGTAARLAAERGVAADLLGEAQEAVRQLDRAFTSKQIDMSIYSKWNSTFHSLLSRMSGSEVIARELDRVTALPFASPSAFLDDDDHADRFRLTLLAAQEQHRSIVEAIEARQGARAESLAREHARAAHRNVDFLTTDAAAMREGSATLAIVSP